MANELPVPHEFVWISGPNGYMAASFHSASSGEPGPAVLMCHGFTGHRIEAHTLFVQAARAFAASGISVLRFDFTGSGESEGAFADMTVESEIADALEALEYLAERPEVDHRRIAVLGLSLGGAVAACTVARSDIAKLLVLWAAVADLAEIGERFAHERAPSRLPDGTYDVGGMAVGEGFVQSLNSVRPLDEVGRFRGRVLIVHGGADDVVPPKHAEQYKGVLGDRAELHIIPGSDHVFSSVPWQSEAIEITTSFLQASL